MGPSSHIKQHRIDSRVGMLRREDDNSPEAIAKARRIGELNRLRSVGKRIPLKPR